MCLILLAYKTHPDFPLIVIANRDEYYRRPTQNTHWWPEHSSLLAGKDLQSGGTWLGINRRGDFAAITNVREKTSTTERLRSRGHLPLAYLTESFSDNAFQKKLMATKTEYRGYNLLFGSVRQLQYFSNRIPTPVKLQPGLYGLSNAQLDTPWPKVARGKHKLSDRVKASTLKPEDLFEISDDMHMFPDNLLPDTGVSLEFERLLSAICISGEDYGTRSSSVLLIDNNNSVTLHEKVRAPERGPLIEFTFQINADA